MNLTNQHIGTNLGFWSQIRGRIAFELAMTLLIAVIVAAAIAYESLANRSSASAAVQGVPLAPDAELVEFRHGEQGAAGVAADGPPDDGLVEFRHGEQGVADRNTVTLNPAFVEFRRGER